MKLLKNGNPGAVNIAAASELQIVIDITHEPWRTISGKMLQTLEAELNECGLTIGNIAQLLDVIYQQPKELQ